MNSTKLANRIIGLMFIASGLFAIWWHDFGWAIILLVSGVGIYAGDEKPVDGKPSAWVPKDNWVE